MRLMFSSGLKYSQQLYSQRSYVAFCAYMNYLSVDSFSQAERQKQEAEEGGWFHLLFFSPNARNRQGWVKSGVQNSVWVSHVDGKDSHSWAISSVCAATDGRKLAWEWGWHWSLGTPSVEHGHPKWHHNYYTNSLPPIHAFCLFKWHTFDWIIITVTLTVISAYR